MPAPAYTPLPTNASVPLSGLTFNPESLPLPPPDQSPFTALGLGYIKKFREERLSSLRPFSEFFNTSRMSKPDGVGTVITRLNHNLPYFQGNYTVVFLGITAYNLVSNSMLMFSVGFTLGGMHFISKVSPEGIIVGTTRYNPRQLQTGLACAAVPLFFFSSTLGTIFYIVGASAVSILGHASFMQVGVEDSNV
ncbi:PRA1 family protein-domain-containing protein [Lobosporangium transversale]|uniref:PRA1 family protein n=1 Tax=Lobosporangium transversale TaxID=64571 RepID=A0A1Y2GJC4_9FUNG|nr:PRA1 family protein-domain-containing protein [Lobosporangium transversale]ORZ11365.1 PRA1 family protein-domain-containing protein [Lobosporangium transversale]|eukprot:XP_021879680.1 PRA1 family protein-domain-containing protein [Lobosporangium transversale]